MKRVTDEERASIVAKLTPPEVSHRHSHLWGKCVSLLSGAALGQVGLSVDWNILDRCAERLKWRLTAWDAETVLEMAKAWLKASMPSSPRTSGE